MKRWVVICVVVGALAAAGCKETTEMLGGGDDPVGVDATPIVIHSDCGAMDLFQMELDPVTIQTIALSADRMTIAVAYSGGCADHTFTLHACDVFLESWPPQSDVMLVHADPDDPCDAVVTEDVVFDLVPLKDTYRASQGRSRTLKLNVYASGDPPYYQPQPLYDMGSD